MPGITAGQNRSWWNVDRRCSVQCGPRRQGSALVAPIGAAASRRGAAAVVSAAAPGQAGASSPRFGAVVTVRAGAAPAPPPLCPALPAARPGGGAQPRARVALFWAATPPRTSGSRQTGRSGSRDFRPANCPPGFIARPPAGGSPIGARPLPPGPAANPVAPPFSTARLKKARATRAAPPPLLFRRSALCYAPLRPLGSRPKQARSALFRSLRRLRRRPSGLRRPGAPPRGRLQGSLPLTLAAAPPSSGGLPGRGPMRGGGAGRCKQRPKKAPRPPPRRGAEIDHPSPASPPIFVGGEEPRRARRDFPGGRGRVSASRWPPPPRGCCSEQGGVYTLGEAHEGCASGPGGTAPDHRRARTFRGGKSRT